MDRLEFAREGGGRQILASTSTVGFAAQPFVQNGDDAAVVAAPDQPAKTLFERQGHQRGHVLREAGTPFCLDRPHPGIVQRVPRRRKGHLVHHHQAQIVARDVDPFPEGTGRQQYAVGGRLEPAQQRVARGIPLRAERPDQRTLAILQTVADLLQAAPAGKQAQRTATADFEQPLQLSGDSVVERSRAAVVEGGQRRLVEQRLTWVVEDCWQHLLFADPANSAAGLVVLEMASCRQCGAGADHRARQRVAVFIFGVKQIGGQQPRWVDRGGMYLQRDVAPFEDAHRIAHPVAVLAGAADHVEFFRGAVERSDCSLVGAKAFGCVGAGALALLCCLLDSGCIGIFLLEPFAELGQRTAQLEQALQIPLELEGIFAAAVGNLLEGQDVELAQPIEIAVAKRFFEERTGEQLFDRVVGHQHLVDRSRNLLEMVCLVDNVDGRRRQDAFAGKPQFQRVEQQVVIGDEDLGLGSFVAHSVDPAALFVVAAIVVQTVVGETDDPVAQVAAKHKGQLVDVSGGGLGQPRLQRLKLVVGTVVERDVGLFLALFVQLMGADEIAASFDHHRRDRPAQHLAQEGKLFVEELALQRFVGGGDDHCLPAEDRRDQIGDRFAGASRRFDQGVRMGHQRPLDRLGHLQLAVASFVRMQRAGQRALGAKKGRQIHRRQLSQRTGVRAGIVRPGILLLRGDLVRQVV